MGQTLVTDLSQVRGLDRPYGNGVRMSDMISELRDRSTPPAGVTTAAGGTLHDKNGHAAVSGRSAPLPLHNWRMATGTALGIASSVTLPYFAWSSGVRSIVWPANNQQELQQDVLVPSDYDQSGDTQAVALLVRSLAGGTAVEMTGMVGFVSPGLALSTVTPGTAALTAGATAAQKVTLSITNAALLQKDQLSVQIAPSGNATGANVELFGSYLEYTAEE